MGGKSGGDQITGYRYYANLVVMIGNRIEFLHGINFDKRGWITGKRVPHGENGDTISIDATELYGAEEGGVQGVVRAKYGASNQTVDENYASYLVEKDLPALAYPYLSYLVFKGANLIKGALELTLEQKQELANEYHSGVVPTGSFYFGNNPFLKEMMLWVKRTRVRNDGRVQWYEKAGDGAIVCEIGGFETIGSSGKNSADIPFFNYSFVDTGGLGSYTKALGVYGSGGSSAYGGIENSTFSEIIRFIPIAAELDLFDLVEITATISGSVRNIEHSLKNASQVYEYSVKTMGDENTEKYIVIYIVCKKGEGFPYLEVKGTGTIKLPGGGTNYFFWTFSSQTKPLDFFDYENKKNGIDINPVHKIREILTDDTAMNINESEINDENFILAADQIYSEGLGISTVFIEKNCKEALDEICSHIEAGVRVNRQTGKYEVILFRDNWYDLDNALHFDQSNIKRGSFTVEVMNTDDAINVLNVNYYDRTNIKNSSFNVYENGLIQTLGRENAETVDLPYFMNQRNAEIVANWKLKQLSTPAWRGSFSTSHRAARKLNRYDIITVTWPSKQIYNMPVRVMKINLGTVTDTSATIDFVEVVSYSNNLNSSIVVDTPVSGILPPQPANPIAFEVPYYALVQLLGQREADAQLEYNSELGYLGVAAEKPQNNSLNALLYTDGGTGDYSQFQKVGVVDYSSGVYLDQQISQLDISFAVIDLDYVQNGAPKFSGVAVGTIGQLNSELISFLSYDAETKILTVKRGVLDTVPTKHIAGNIHFWGESFAYDSTEYAMGETVGAQVLTTTPSGVDLLNPGAIKKVEMNARAIRPYPPANVKINGEYWGKEYEDFLNITWSHRSRLQQTGGDILGFYEGGVAAEIGVTYILKVFEINDSNNEVEFFNQNIGFADNYTIDLSELLNTSKSIRIELSSDRDGFSSYQVYEHTMFASFNAPNNLVATYTDGDIYLNWGFDA
ncbi:phage tail protein [Acinetobacter harbinensis]|uniref:phage tail protein n=1 Tax=Acinetobacter harbinensis TaxID=1353941 RepID=UPI001C4E7EF4|nr:phage tail protein [Acinetobacter harbinensis]